MSTPLLTQKKLTYKEREKGCLQTVLPFRASFASLIRNVRLVLWQGKVLCPLVNVPMIDYTLEFLARNEVKEVFVFCVSHAKQLEDYLSSSTWNEQLEVSDKPTHVLEIKPSSSFLALHAAVTCVLSCCCQLEVG